MLKLIPDLDQIESYRTYFNSKNTNFLQSEVFYQFFYIKSMVTALMDKHYDDGKEDKDSNWESLNSSERWVRSFASLDKGQHSKLLKICYYLFSILAHNGIMESFLMSLQLNDEPRVLLEPLD